MKKKNLWITLAVIAAVIGVLLYLGRYEAGPWRGKVIDAETGEPIVGAAVVGVWYSDFRLDPSGGHTFTRDVIEKVTDTNGEFKVQPKSFLSIPFIREIKGPWFIIYKPGYGSFPKNQVRPKSTPANLFAGNGAEVVLPRAITKGERLDSLADVDYLEMLVPSNYIPKLKELLKEENKLLGYGSQSKGE